MPAMVNTVLPPGGSPLSKPSLFSLFLVFLRLGLTSFGGPIAHLGYFRTEFVTRRHWVSDESFAGIVALCQFLPGPASSQTGIAIGLIRGGLSGALLAWLGFTLPSAALMIGFAYASGAIDAQGLTLWTHGLLVVAVAVVAQAVWSMARSLAPDLPRAAMALTAAAAVLTVPLSWTPLAVLAFAALAGRYLLNAKAMSGNADIPPTVPPGLARLAGVTFLALLVLLPVAAYLTGDHVLEIVDRFFRVGSLVFGGGHVVLPMLESEVVPPGWIAQRDFLAGYGAAQALPGPLFTFAAYLGAAMKLAPNGWPGGLIALAAIFAPSFLLVIATLPFWNGLRRNAAARAALLGVNAAVVGILLAALYNPVWVSAIHNAKDFILAAIAFVALQLRAPPIAVVAATVIAARLLA